MTIDSTLVRLIAYDTGTGNVPAYDTVISQGSASGKMIGVYSALNVAPTTPGSAMPASGFILIRQWNETPYTTGALTGIGANATAADRQGWIEVVAEEARTITVNRLNNQTEKLLKGKGWFKIGTTGGSRSDTYQIPTNGVNQYHAGVWADVTAPVSISSITWSSGVATVNTSSAHGLSTHDRVIIDGVIPYKYNIAERVTVVDSDTFTVPITSNPGTYVSGGDVAKVKFFPVTASTALVDNVDTDVELGRYCWISTSTGVLRFGHDGTNSTGGYLPPSGRRIFIPSKFLTAAPPASRTQNNLNATTTSRGRFVPTASGKVDIEGASGIWLITYTTPYSVIVRDCSLYQNASITNPGTDVIFDNVGFGCAETQTATLFSLTTATGTNIFRDVCFSIGLRTGSNIRNFYPVDSNNVTTDRCEFLQTGVRSSTSQELFTTSRCIKVDATNCTFAGSKIYLTTVKSATLTNTRWANFTGTLSGNHLTQPLSAFEITSNVDGVTIDGVEFIDNRVPRNYLVTGAAGSNNIIVKNIGTYDTPISPGFYEENGATYTRSGTTITVTTAAPHGFLVNDIVVVWQSQNSGATNGAKTITAVTSNTFQFVNTNAGALSGTLSFYGGVMHSLTDMAIANNVKFQNIHFRQNRANQYTAASTVNGIQFQNVSLDPRYTAASLYAALNITQDSVLFPHQMYTPSNAAYGTRMVSQFTYETPGLKDFTATWSRVTATYTVTTATPHGMGSSAYVYIYEIDNETGTSKGVVKVATITGTNTFTFSGLNTGTTSGNCKFRFADSRLGLIMNEPSGENSANVTLTGTASFTGGGQVILPALNDSITWESEKYILGFDSVPNIPSIQVAGTQTQHDVTYDIDRGSGFSGTYKNLDYTRTGAGGTAASTTVTMTDTTGVAVGDYVYGAGIGTDAKVISIDSGTAITVSVANTATVSGSLSFNALPNEATFPSTGVKFRIKITANTSGASAFTAIFVPMNSTNASRNRLYPQDVDSLTFTLSGLPSGTTVALYDSTDTELKREDNILTGEFTYDWIYEGSDIEDVYYVIWHEDYIPFKSTPFDLSSENIGQSYTPQDDTVYDAAYTDRYTIDYANKRIIMNSSQTIYDVRGAYSKWKDNIFLADNFTYDFAFETLGNVVYDSPKRVPPFTALINNWKIRPDEANHTLTVSGGILYVDGGGDPFVDTLGAYTVRINYVQPVEVLMIATGSGVTPSDVTDIANAVQTELNDDFAAIPTATENADEVWAKSISGKVASNRLKDADENAELVTF